MSDRAAQRPDAVVSDDLAQKFKTEKDTPYLRWVRSEGLDIISAHYVRNLRTVELKPWARRGGRGVFLNHDASRTIERLLRLRDRAGRQARAAAADVRGDGVHPRRTRLDHGLERCRRSASPSNGRPARSSAFRSIAGTSISTAPGQAPVRYVAVTNAPSVINLYEDLDFVFGHERDFKGRFSGEPDYFAAGKELQGWTLTTNFIADALNLPLPIAEERGAGGGHIRFSLARASLARPYLAVPGRDLQEGACARAGRPRHHSQRRGLHADVARRWGDPIRYDWEVGTLHRATECASTISISTPAPRRRAISPSGTAARRATRRGCCSAS